MLVVGGGDGGTVTQLLHFARVEQIVWVEIDALVVETAASFFPKLKRAHTDPRVKVVYENAATWIRRQATNNITQFDLILLDTTDFNAAEPLFTHHFYELCHQLVASGGILAFNVDSGLWGQIRMAASSERLSRIFKYSFLYQAYVPTYSSGHYTWMLASDSVHPYRTSVNWTEHFRQHHSTCYYTPDIHIGAFALPHQVQGVVHHVAEMRDLQPSMLRSLPTIPFRHSSK